MDLTHQTPPKIEGKVEVVKDEDYKGVLVMVLITRNPKSNP
jgi:hypothetical protein